MRFSSFQSGANVHRDVVHVKASTGVSQDTVACPRPRAMLCNTHLHRDVPHHGLLPAFCCFFCCCCCPPAQQGSSSACATDTRWSLSDTWLLGIAHSILHEPSKGIAWRSSNGRQSLKCRAIIPPAFATKHASQLLPDLCNT